MAPSSAADLVGRSACYEEFPTALHDRAPVRKGTCCPPPTRIIILVDRKQKEKIGQIEVTTSRKECVRYSTLL